MILHILLPSEYSYVSVELKYIIQLNIMLFLFIHSCIICREGIMGTQVLWENGLIERSAPSKIVVVKSLDRLNARELP